jgi:hypothetical protein
MATHHVGLKVSQVRDGFIFYISDLRPQIYRLGTCPGVPHAAIRICKILLTGSRRQAAKRRGCEDT